MNKTLYLFAGALLAVGASSCSSDEPGAPDVAQKDETRYIRVNILPTGSSSRAESFENGTDDENAFGTVYMDFYDKNGNFISRSFPSDMQPADNPTIGTPNVEESYSKIVKVEIEAGKENPAYVMCYINPVSYQNAAINMTNLRLETRNNYINGGKFAMNNSCYYADDPQTDENTVVKISGTPFPKNLKLFNSYEEANASTEASLDIYVERYAAKVKFKLDDTKISPYTINGAQTVNLTFVPEAWTINATEAQMYVVKNFSLDADNLTPTGTPPTYNEIYNNGNGALGTWSWNDATRNRSYWACSPGYFATQFPSVADDIADGYYKDHSTVTDGTQYGAGLAVVPYYQKYYSYNQIFNDTEDKAAANGNDNFGTGDNFMYALETTMTKAAFNSGNPKAAVPAVLVVGKYNVDYAGTKLADNTSFYLFEGNVYFADGNVKDKDNNAVSGTTTIMDCLLNKQTVLYSDAAGNTKVTANSAAYNLKVMHPSSDVRELRTNSKVPSRYVTLQITNIPTGLYYKDGDNIKQIQNEEDVKKANYALWTQMSVAEAYTNGKCFFYIPIRHLRWTEDAPTGAGKELETNGVINWGNLRSGDMGLVRNHVYSLEVSEVKGLATGIENLDYPILPAADNQHYIKYRVNILAWRVVPVQGGIIL